jgi:hypothetical protein
MITHIVWRRLVAEDRVGFEGYQSAMILIIQGIYMMRSLFTRLKYLAAAEHNVDCRQDWTAKSIEHYGERNHEA